MFFLLNWISKNHPLSDAKVKKTCSKRNNLIFIHKDAFNIRNIGEKKSMLSNCLLTKKFCKPGRSCLLIQR
jgi:hypothetical protein